MRKVNKLSHWVRKNYFFLKMFFKRWIIIQLMIMMRYSRYNFGTQGNNYVQTFFAKKTLCISRLITVVFDAFRMRH